MIGIIILGIIVLVAVVFAAMSVKIVRPTERGLIETLGKYTGFAEPGMHLIIPIYQNIVYVDITENMMEIDTQEIITEDNLNADVDLVVYYKVIEDEKSVKKSVYKVSNFEPQIVRLAQTTARNVIGTLVFKDVNSHRNKLNAELAKILKSETTNWGVEIVRVELKDIIPPKDVQNTMNQVIMAENTKRAAIDFATAAETKADGEKRASIKMAEGQKEALILKATGEAEAKIKNATADAQSIKLVNEAANKYFVGNAQKLRALEATEKSLKKGTKIIIDGKSKLQTIVTDVAGAIVPTSQKS